MYTLINVYDQAEDGADSICTWSTSESPVVPAIGDDFSYDELKPNRQESWYYTVVGRHVAYTRTYNEYLTPSAYMVVEVYVEKKNIGRRTIKYTEKTEGE